MVDVALNDSGYRKMQTKKNEIFGGKKKDFLNNENSSLASLFSSKEDTLPESRGYIDESDLSDFIKEEIPDFIDQQIQELKDSKK